MYLNRNNELEVLQLYLGGYAKQFYLREISRLIKLPLKNVQRLLSCLEKNKILRSKVHGKNKYFSVNLDNIQSKLYLARAEIYRTQLFLEKYPQCKTFAKELGNTPILVFGSFAKFAPEKDSDMDILVIGGEKGKLPLHLLPYKVQEIRLQEKSFIRAVETKEPLIKEIEEHHVILGNHSFYVDAMWSHYAK